MATIIIVSILVALVFAPLGCLVLWKRYVYVSDGLAHSSMLAGIVSVVAGVPVLYAGLVSTSVFTYMIFKLKNNSGNNAAVGLTSSMMIAASLVLSYIHPGGVNFTKFFIGDIISSDASDIGILLIVLTSIVIFFLSCYNELILTILSKDIAAIQGVNVKLLELIFLAILSFSVLSAIKIVGALMVTSVMLIPSMTAHLIAKSPRQMLGLAIFFALVMNFIGVIASFFFDTPFAPTVILCGGMLYLISWAVKRRYLI